VSRAWFLGAGVVLLAAAAVGGEAPPRSAGPLEALGRSLGGWRIAVVDVLALRAEALRRQGRIDEVVVAYETMVGLDPDNAAAAEALSDLIVTQGLDAAQTDAQRVERWGDAWRLVEAGLKVHPTSALLAMRAGLLLLESAERGPALEQAVDERLGGAARRETLGLAYLRVAAEAQEFLPRTGRAHLVALAREAPRLAARALARGQDDAEVRARLAAGLDLLRIQPRAAIEVEELADPTPEEPEGRPVRLHVRLEAHAALLDAALEARRNGTRAALGPALDAFEGRVGRTSTSRVLRAWSAS
jgi:hypothetical protein